MQLLDNYNLILIDEMPPRLVTRPGAQAGKAAQVLSSLIFSLGNGGFYFNLKELLRNFIEVKYGLKESFSFYPEGEEVSILVTKEMVYFTSIANEKK